MRLPIPRAFITLEVRDKHGRLLQRHRQQCHSWTRNAYNILFCKLAGKDADDSTFEAGKLSAKDTGGSIRYGDAPAGIDYGPNTLDGTARGYRAPASEDDWGIIVGSGVNAESFEDYALQTQIADGTGSGQLSYQESEAHSVSYTAGTKVLKNELIRYFNNNSGDTISVNEVGLVARGHVAIARNILVDREKLASTVNIPDTGQLKVTYTIQLTYAG